MKAKDLLNKEVRVYNKRGELYSPKCEVFEIIGRTKLRVRDIDRGPGKEFTVHVKFVELIKSTEQ